MNIYTVGCVNVPKVIKCMLHGAQLMSLVINDSPSEKNLKILLFLIWTKAFKVYLLSVCSGRSRKKSICLKIILTIAQMIKIFNMFRTRIQTNKNNLDQNSNTRGTMISNNLKTPIFTP